MGRKEQIRLIETHLKNYNTYLIGMKNVQKSLEDILPSGIDEAVLDRITSSRVHYLREVLNTYKTIVCSIDDALSSLSENERKLVTYRYFKGLSVEKTAQLLGCSQQNFFKIRGQVFEKLLIILKNLQHISPDL